MMWIIIWGHSYLIQQMAHMNLNVLNIPTILKGKINVPLTLTTYTVDHFFFIGGFFSGYVLPAKLEKVKPKHFPLFYLKIVVMRYLRIMPAYMAAMFFNWKL